MTWLEVILVIALVFGLIWLVVSNIKWFPLACIIVLIVFVIWVVVSSIKRKPPKQ